MSRTPEKWSEEQLWELIEKSIHHYAGNFSVTDYRDGEDAFTYRFLAKIVDHIEDQSLRNDDVEYRLSKLEEAIEGNEKKDSKVRRLDTSSLDLNAPQMAIFIRALADAKVLADNKEAIVDQIYSLTKNAKSSLMKRVKEFNSEITKTNFSKDADQVILSLKRMIQFIEDVKDKSSKEIAKKRHQ